MTTRKPKTNARKNLVKTKKVATLSHAPSRLSSKVAKISHVRHTGKRVAIHHTSYALLFLLLLLTATCLYFLRTSAVAGQTSWDNSIGLSGVVKAIPPANTPIISTPVNRSVVYASLVTVKGLCEKGFLVDVYRNTALAGTALCSQEGLFSLTLTAAPGDNTLRARLRNYSDQYGPYSLLVQFSYVQRPKLATSPVFVSVSSVISGGQVDSQISLEYAIHGGTPGYALSIDWRDGSRNELSFVGQEGTYSVGHVYKKPGQYEVIFTVTDARQSQASYETIVVIVGQTKSNPLFSKADLNSCNYLIDEAGVCYIRSQFVENIDRLWSAFSVCLLMAFSFWLGERIVYQRIAKHTKRS